MSELRRVGILVRALGYRLLGIRILICSARCGRKRYQHHEIGIAQESRVEAIDRGIRFLLAIASEPAMLAELSAELSALMLVNLLVVMP